MRHLLIPVLFGLCTTLACYIYRIDTPQCKFVNEFIENGHAGTTYEEYKRHGANYTVTVKGFPSLPIK